MGVWLTERAQVVEEMTGQLHTAVRLLRLAQEFHPEDTLTRQLSTVASLQDGLQGGRPHLTLHPCCASLLHCQPVSHLTLRLCCISSASSGCVYGGKQQQASLCHTTWSVQGCVRCMCVTAELNNNSQI